MMLPTDIPLALRAVALSTGLLGIFALTLFDSSLLWLLPGINDLVLISYIIAKGKVAWAAAAVVFATTGSVVGASASYRIGRRGGSGLMRKRFPPALLRRIEVWTDRWGAIPVGIAAVMPPPLPYAPFVFSAGMMKVPINRFRLSVGIGRGVRYSFVAALALYVGRHLMSELHRFYWAAFEPAIIIVAIALLVWGIFRLQFAGAPSYLPFPSQLGDESETQADCNGSAPSQPVSDPNRTASPRR